MGSLGAFGRRVVASFGEWNLVLADKAFRRRRVTRSAASPTALLQRWPLLAGLAALRATLRDRLKSRKPRRPSSRLPKNCLLH